MLTVTIRTPGDLRALRRRLAEPRPLLAQIGSQLKRTSDKAFDEQRLGEIPWAARYPSQDEPFVNKAAILERANRGQPPRPNDFDRRPALRGTGDLQKDVRSTWEITPEGGTVETRSGLPYSGKMQGGGETSFEVTQTARDLLRKWALTLGSPAGLGVSKGRLATLRIKDAQDNPTSKKPRRGKGIPKLDGRARKILLLSYLHRWRQDVIARPFIGVTDEAGKIVTRIAEHFFATGAS